ncbi:hypothetical protein PTSG_10562 [Salpingoeca rosetta]|uniref:Peptidase C-terminal archaeal/bacterial domain-containing protein n=1 Tax=Salpingoeca rosetta (strain ATCC 50818 / BSB-021) TaxID=946362 RepID=F2URQ2_SALR5|nr:uncharacterized protein PTSG_10562 [Salpingoeca rosetta]EGD80307.1 hypothetical protein PTSG_10562 [Salpingoeca rosetta]|eukprot:XP_004988097.1 hypothetical protein PTSG_10562 [Salpingoeca rosetta]
MTTTAIISTTKRRDTLTLTRRRPMMMMTKAASRWLVAAVVMAALLCLSGSKHPATLAAPLPSDGDDTSTNNNNNNDNGPAVERMTSANCHHIPIIHDQLEALSPEAKDTAMANMDSHHLTVADAESIRFGPNGELVFVDTFEIPPVDDGNQGGGGDSSSNNDDARVGEASAAAHRGRRFLKVHPPNRYDANGLPIYHSRKGSRNVIFLDFDGHWLPDASYWGGFTAGPYDPSDDGLAFNAVEQGQIALIWARVAEDYAPFDVDVTTEPFDIQTATSIHALITESVQVGGSPMPYDTAGGVAVLDVFNSRYLPYYSPALVYYDNLGGGINDYVAEATSHEIGHNFGLSHDGYYGDEYAGGFDGNYFTSWAPLMGTGYTRALSQWSNGEYDGATNTEDDIGIISAQTGFVADVAGDRPGTAAAVRFLTDTDFEGKGIILNRDDKDWWAITLAVDGTIDVVVSPWFALSRTPGNNLDVKLTLYDSASSEVDAANPSSFTEATIQTALLPAGTYYLEVDGTYDGSVITSDYGSAGQYFISGSISPGPRTTVTYTPLPTSTTTQVGCSNDEYEPNNHFQDATALPLGDTAFSAHLCPGEADWYRTRVCPGGSLSISITFGTGDFDAFLFSPDGTYVAVGATDTPNELVAYTDSGYGGFYYLEVFPYSGSGGYEVAVTITGCDFSTTTSVATTSAFPPLTCPENDQYENNNKKRRASDIPLSTTIYAIACETEQDWYKLETCKGATVTATIEIEPSTVGDINLSIRNRRGKQVSLTRLRNGETSGVVTTTAGRNGNHYVTIASKDGKNPIYSLVVETTETPPCS